MIIDVHSHAWEFPTHFSDDFRQQAKIAKAGVEVNLTVQYDEYRAAATTDAVTTIVFGGKARLSGLWVDDQYVANYVAASPETVIGFLSVDASVEGLRSLNQMLEGSSLPRLDVDEIESLIYRDSLTLLGLA